MRTPPKKSRFLRTVYNWMSQFGDPVKTVRAVRHIGWYVRDYHRYRRMRDAEPVSLIDSWPQLHDRQPKTPFDAHYFWMGGWAMRRIVSQRSKQHVDVGSQVMFVNLLSAVLPVTFVDCRPLDVRIEGLTCPRGDILNLPFEAESVESLSCLHVAEHIGLGRYGDVLNPHGTREACAELQRVLAVGGSLYFALPVGVQRVCFNAHRIHMPSTIVDYFPGLELLEFSGVHDDGTYVECVNSDSFAHDRYACGMFHFRKPRRTA